MCLYCSCSVVVFTSWQFASLHLYFRSQIQQTDFVMRSWTQKEPRKATVGQVLKAKAGCSATSRESLYLIAPRWYGFTLFGVSSATKYVNQCCESQSTTIWVVSYYFGLSCLGMFCVASCSVPMWQWSQNSETCRVRWPASPCTTRTGTWTAGTCHIYLI